MIGIKKSLSNLIEIPFMGLSERHFSIKYRAENQWITNSDMNKA